MEKKILKIDEIEILDELYPRRTHDEETAIKYSTCMELGDEFPPVVVAFFDGKYILVDGKHRIKAREMNGEEFIDCEIIKCNSEKDIFVESVKRNVTHGKPFEEEDLKEIRITLEDFKVDISDISKLIRVPTSELKYSTANKIDNLEFENKTPNAFDGWDDSIETGKTPEENYQEKIKRGVNNLINEDDFTIIKFQEQIDLLNRRLTGFSAYMGEFGNINNKSFEGKEVKTSLNNIINLINKINQIIKIKEDLIEIKKKLEKSLK